MLFFIFLTNVDPGFVTLDSCCLSFWILLFKGKQYLFLYNCAISPFIDVNIQYTI